MENQIDKVVSNVSASNDGLSKIAYNKKMLNKWVFCTLDGGFYGLVMDILDAENFKIKTEKGEERIVSLFDVRAA